MVGYLTGQGKVKDGKRGPSSGRTAQRFLMDFSWKNSAPWSFYLWQSSHFAIFLLCQVFFALSNSEEARRSLEQLRTSFLCKAKRRTNASTPTRIYTVANYKTRNRRIKKTRNNQLHTSKIPEKLIWRMLSIKFAPTYGNF